MKEHARPAHTPGFTAPSQEHQDSELSLNISSKLARSKSTVSQKASVESKPNEKSEPCRIFNSPAGQSEEHPVRSLIRGLPTLQFQVLGGLLAGQEAQDLCDSLGIAEEKIHQAVSHLCERFSVSGPAELVHIFKPPVRGQV